jgi:two-component sensor histidine kinase
LGRTLTGFANVLAGAVALTARTAELQAALDRAELLAAQNEARAAEKALLADELQRLLKEKDTLASELQRLLEEKETLAEELQHRARNSLQFIHAMLNKDLTDGEARAAIKAAARRVTTLAQVYEHLLGTGMTRTTNFASFALALCDGLRTIRGW